MKKTIMIAAVTALVAGCGAPETKTADVAAAPAKPACEPPPTTIVTKDLVEGDGRTAIPLASAIGVLHGLALRSVQAGPQGRAVRQQRRAARAVRVSHRRRPRDQGLGRRRGRHEGGRQAAPHHPSAYGYGSREIPGKIPPDSALVFEVDLMQLAGPNLPPPMNRPPKQ
jgi:hypothetical protein